MAESFNLAKQYVYVPPIGTGVGPFTMTTAYFDAAKRVAEARIALAGVRLATLLNGSYEIGVLLVDFPEDEENFGDEEPGQGAMLAVLEERATRGKGVEVREAVSPSRGKRWAPYGRNPWYGSP